MTVDMQMNILIVDDYKTMLRIIRNLLKQLGFNNVDEATDGSMALQKLRDKDYGLVISDWNMEPMTGIQLLREVRADAKLKALPFIMITAESKTENVIAAKEAGVNNYIVKPFNAATLKTKLSASVIGDLLSGALNSGRIPGMSGTVPAELVAKLSSLKTKIPTYSRDEIEEVVTEMLASMEGDLSEMKPQALCRGGVPGALHREREKRDRRAAPGRDP